MSSFVFTVRNYAARGTVWMPRLRNTAAVQNPNGSFVHIPTELPPHPTHSASSPILAPNSPTKPFTLPLFRVIFQYCSHMKDSEGMRDYLKTLLIPWARLHPTVECIVRPMFGRRRQICVKNMTPAEIQSRLSFLRDLRGPSDKERFYERIETKSPSVRPIWDPWHGSNATNPLTHPNEHKQWRLQLKSDQVHRAALRKQSREALFPE